MSSNQTAKPMPKPLKGQVQGYGIGDFSELNAAQISIPGLLENGVITNIEIEDSVINNTTIGVDIPNIGYFTNLTVTGNVSFTGLGNLYWNASSGTLIANANFQVTGCSILGNIEICNNTIKAINLNGGIDLKVNGFGTLYQEGPITHVASFGNVLSNVISGSYTVNALNNIDFKSHNSSYSLTTLKDQILNTRNGDIKLQTESSLQSILITSVIQTQGALIVTTSTNHNVVLGDLINITNSNSTNSLNGSHGIFTVLSPTSFLITGPTVTVSGTASFLKVPESNIYFTPKTSVIIPKDIPITFGTVNNISGNTGGLYLSSDNFVIFDTPITNVPLDNKLAFGNTIGSSSLTVKSTDSNSLLLNAETFQINSSFANFYTPIPTLGDYTSNLADQSDRGIQFEYWSPSNNVAQLGWFGYKKSLDAFTFMTNATNNSNVITGESADFFVNNITVNNIDFATVGNLNMGCNDITNINTIYGCNGIININGTNSVNITSQTTAINSNIINITPTQKLTFPSNIPFNFGTFSTLINTTSGLVIGSSQGGILMNSPLVFDGTTGNYKLFYTSGNLYLNTSTGGNFNISGGNVVLNDNQKLFLGSASSILGNTSGIFFSSGITTFNTGSVVQMGNDTSLLFGTQKITGNTSGLYFSSGNININQNSFFNIGNTQFLNNTSGTFVSGGNFLFDNGLFFGGTSASIDYTGTSNGSLVISGNSSNSLIFNAFTNLTTNSPLYFMNSNVSISNTTGGIVIHAGDILLDGDVLLNKGILTVGIQNTTGDSGIEGTYNFTSGPFNTFFGYQTISDSFVFYSKSIINNETVSGTLGNLTIAGINFSGGSSINSNGYNLNCGTLANVKLITACNGILNVSSTSGVNITTNSLNLHQNTVINFDTSSNISNSVGNLVLSANNKVIINADLQVNGTTSNVYSTVTNIQDPIISLGGVTGPIINDLKDRGIEFKYYTSSTKTGFIGYKNSLDRVVVIKDGTNTNEVFSGAYSDFQIGGLYSTSVFLNNDTNPSLITSTTDLVISSGTLYLPSINHISHGSIIATNGNLLIQNTTGCIIFDSPCIRIGGTTLSDSVGNFTITSGNSISLLSSTGNINVNSPNGSVYLSQTFISEGNFFGLSGNTSNSLVSSNGNLIINGLDNIVLNSNDVIINGNVYNPALNLLSQDPQYYIYPIGTSQRVSVTNVSNTSTTGVLLVTVDTNPYLVSGDTIKIFNSFDVDGQYSVQNVISPTTFTINHSNLVTSVTTGTLQSNLTLNQNKDVGLQVNYWSSQGGTSATSGTINYNTGFFGFKYSTHQWTFYNDATIANNVVVSGQLGDILINKVNTGFISGFTLQGTLTAGNSLIAGNNFNVLGGTIQNTPIGNSTASTIRGSSITNTVSASLLNLTASSNMNYSVERFTLSSGTPTGSPTNNTIVTFVSVSGTSLTASGTMGSTGLTDGAIKVIICASMGTSCLYKLAFASGTLTTPTPCGTSASTLITMKHTGQGIQLIWNSSSNSWFFMNSGVFVS